MLASRPVSMLNQNLDDLGIPIRINLISSRSNVSGGKSGTGKVTFKEFSITKRIDVAMP